MGKANFSKVKPLGDLLRTLSRQRKQKKKVVFTNGCFDILHAGHVKLLNRAKSLGDILIVGLNSDASVRRLKGAKRPLTSQSDRGLVMSALEPVDFVVFFGEDTPYDLIKKIRPDILVKGGDYKKSGIVGREFAGRVARVPLAAGKSTTSLVKKIAGLYGKARR